MVVIVSIDPDLKFKTAERGLMPVQLIFCLKEKNVRLTPPPTFTSSLMIRVNPTDSSHETGKED